jgi:nicotinate-nucleotide pyrophosphorylase
MIDPEVEFEFEVADGDRIEKEQNLARVIGGGWSHLDSERYALPYPTGVF